MDLKLNKWSEGKHVSKNKNFWFPTDEAVDSQ